MKKLILISIIGMMLNGCSNRSIGYKAKIIEITTFESGLCKYYTTGSLFTGTFNTVNIEHPSFIDSCDKFHIGDVIKITK